MNTHTHAGTCERLRQVVEHAARYLPAQGPLGLFVHHNPLHALQHKHFEEAVIEGARLYGAEPFFSEEAYQTERHRGRILDEDIDAILNREPDADILPGRLTRRQLRRAMLTSGLRRTTISWQLEESGRDPLWQACLARVKPQPAPAASRPKRPRDAILAESDTDVDQMVHPQLIRFVSAYLDQGIASWPMPHREEGLLSAARRIMRHPDANMDAESVVLDALDQLAVPQDQWDEFILAELLALPGWAGMIHLRCAIMQFLALRLTFTIAALKHIAGDTTSWRSMRVPAARFDPLTPIASLFNAAQLLGIRCNELKDLPDEDLALLRREIDACHETERRRLLHLAYERRHERRILIPLAKHRVMPRKTPCSNRLVAQVIFCIDEREECFRRVLEEVDQCIETVGAAGSFGMDIHDAGAAPCPVILNPARGWLSFFSLGRWIKRLNRASLPEQVRDATTTQEQAERVYSVLGPAGLHKGHARLVVILGHGSTSLNNPHESAFCCDGHSGAPNARLFALVANRPEVREALRAKGVTIPEDTWFLGGYHDTCSEEIHFFDLDLVPENHHADLVRVHQSLDKARMLSAHERSRRFEAAGSDVRPERSLRQVQKRAENLGEPRPEYGHSTNAGAFVGRREITKGLFMDRRAFLVSYDATKDASNEALGRVLGAVMPVCAGISLEYYFSTVDVETYGSGTKLPHNVTGLIGVMNGFQGDLRTGLPLETVEIHEPVRILFVVETTPVRLMKTIKASAELSELVGNQWIRLATMDPDDGHVEVYRDGVFEKLEGDEEPLPVAPSSRAWYRGKREHLGLARIDPRAAA